MRVRLSERLRYIVEFLRSLLMHPKTVIRTKNESTTDFLSSIGNRNCHISFYYWEI